MTIIDDTMTVLASMGLNAVRVATPVGFAGIQVDLPNYAHAYFVWAKIDRGDYAFRLARFWANENPLSMYVSPNLIDALARTRVLSVQ